MQEKKKIRILLGDRDGLYLQRLKRCLERKEEIVVTGMADNGLLLLEMAREQKPDVILLDMLLSERDGFWVLERLQKERIDCVCVMISAIDSDKLVRRAIFLGADYYMAKPIQGELLLERIYQLVDQDMEQEQEEAEPKEIKTVFRNLEGEISVLLNRMGISASIRGYHFIRSAVIMAVEDQEVLEGITKGLYPDIARRYKTSASKVERAIRHAIESAWKKNGAHVYFEVAGYMPVGKPTNGQFIAVLSEYFRLNEERPKKIS